MFPYCENKQYFIVRDEILVIGHIIKLQCALTSFRQLVENLYNMVPAPRDLDSVSLGEGSRILHFKQVPQMNLIHTT